MNKKEQKLFIEGALKELKDGGITIGWFLKAINLSRTHWFFIKKGERPLTQEKQDKIHEIINKKVYQDQ